MGCGARSSAFPALWGRPAQHPAGPSGSCGLPCPVLPPQEEGPLQVISRQTVLREVKHLKELLFLSPGYTGGLASSTPWRWAGRPGGGGGLEEAPAQRPAQPPGRPHPRPPWGDGLPFRKRGSLTCSPSPDPGGAHFPPGCLTTAGSMVPTQLWERTEMCGLTPCPHKGRGGWGS